MASHLMWNIRKELRNTNLCMYVFILFKFPYLHPLVNIFLLFPNSISSPFPPQCDHPNTRTFNKNERSRFWEISMTTSQQHKKDEHYLYWYPLLIYGHFLQIERFFPFFLQPQRSILFYINLTNFQWLMKGEYWNKWLLLFTCC